MNLPNSLVLLGLVVGFLQSCTENASNMPPTPTPQEQVARTQCGSCHLYPEPALLDTERWSQLLPYMGYRLGIYEGITRESLIGQSYLRGIHTTSYFPAHPVISEQDWEAIKTFYLETSPDEMEPVRRPATIQPGLDHFTLRMPALRFDPPLTMLTQIQSENRLLFMSNCGKPSALDVVNSDGKVLFDWDFEGVPIRVHYDRGRLYVLLIGRGPEPSEARGGSIVFIDGPQAEPVTILQGLKRPVDMEFADLNDDGIEDIVICEFGHWAGLFTLFISTEDNAYERRVLSDVPGAIQAVIHDFDGNGSPDIGVLMAQGDEGIDIYFNDGAGAFTKERKLRFPPVYGSNDLQIADFNDDGRMDLLYVNGDNADITTVVKNYHGLRIFLADAQGSFQESFFFPLPGAVGARVGDFDNDGDLDLVAISYFPDYQTSPEEGFVYLENTGNLTFEAQTMVDSQRGRWLTLDAGDIDGDDDLDILLGSNIGFAPMGDTTGLADRWAKEAPSFVLLENTLVTIR